MDNQAVTTSSSESRKRSKPVMEKRRRARINASLAELKSLLLDAIKMEGTRHSKMEKADILELAVRHLKDVQSHPFSAATNPSSSVLSKYVMGFQACAAEVSKYLSTGGYEDFTLKSKLLNHLADCLAGGDNLPFSSEITSSTLPSTPSSTSVRDDSTHSIIQSSLTSLLSPSSSLSTYSALNQSTVSTLDEIDVNTEEPAIVKQNLVSSSTQNSGLRLSKASPSLSSPLLSSSFLSSLSKHFSSHQQINAVIEGITKVVNEDKTRRVVKKDKHSRRESVIVTSKDDEEETNDDALFNATDEDDDDGDDDDGNDREIDYDLLICKRARLDKNEPKEKEHDMNNNKSNQQQLKTFDTSQSKPFSNLNASKATFAQTPIQSQQMPIHTLLNNPQQLQAQNVQLNERQESRTLPHLGTQQLLGEINTIPYLSQNIQLLPSHPGANDIALVLPTNIVSSNGSIQKVFIPLIQPQALQPPTTAFIAPQFIQPNPTPTIQYQTLHQTLLPSTPSQLTPHSNLMVPITQNQTSTTAECNNHTIKKVSSPIEHNNWNEMNQTLSSLPKTDFSHDHEKACDANKVQTELSPTVDSDSHGMSDLNGQSQCKFFQTSSLEASDGAHKGAPDSSYTETNVTGIIGQFDHSINSKHEMQTTHNQRLQDGLVHPATVEHPPNCTLPTSNGPGSQTISASSHTLPMLNHNSNNNNENYYNNDTKSKNNNTMDISLSRPVRYCLREPSLQQSVVTTSPSSVRDKNNNDSIDPTRLENNNSPGRNRVNDDDDDNTEDPSLPISSNARPNTPPPPPPLLTPYTATSTTTPSTTDVLVSNNKRLHASSPIQNHKRFHLDYTRSKDDVNAVNVLDLSVSAATNLEKDKVPLSTYNNVVHGSRIIEKPTSMIRGDGGGWNDDTARSVTEIEVARIGKDSQGAPAATENSNLCKGTFFRPW